MTRWDASRLVHQLYVPRDAFVAHLRSARRYVPAQDAGSERAALTIDDSTLAGAEAAFLAREFGHDVTLFLNPYQIVTQTPYFFTVLYLAIDQLVERAEQSPRTAGWRAPHFQALRAEARTQLMGLSAEELERRLATILARWQVERPVLPGELRPIDLPTLRRLVSAGVQIGNHGWSHADIAVLSDQALLDDISRTRLWLQEACGQPANLYAVPYGLQTPSDAVLAQLTGDCFLVDATRPTGQLKAGLINRVDVTDALQRVSPQEASAPPHVVGGLHRILKRLTSKPS